MIEWCRTKVAKVGKEKIVDKERKKVRDLGSF